MGKGIRTTIAVDTEVAVIRVAGLPEVEAIGRLLNGEQVACEGPEGINIALHVDAERTFILVGRFAMLVNPLTAAASHEAAARGDDVDSRGRPQPEEWFASDGTTCELFNADVRALRPWT